MQQNKIFQTLNTIEQHSFIERTYMASGYQLVGEIIRRTPEVQFLLECKKVSFPLILARYQENRESVVHETRLMYFVLFGSCQNDAAIPELVSYFISCRIGLGRQKPFFFPWHPFLHGAEALSVLTNNQVEMPTEDEVENHFDLFLKRIRQWIIRSLQD